MCTCASCEYTDRFGGMPDLFGAPIVKDHKHGWENWPRGDPQGKRASDADYRAHVAHSKTGGAKGFRFTITPEPQFSERGTPGCGPIAPAPAVALRWIARSYAWSDLAQHYQPKPSLRAVKRVPYLVQLARDLRAQAQQERRAA